MARLSTFTRAILAGVSASALCAATPIIAPSLAPAAAQTSVAISVEFRTALTPYGSWRTVPRWGEVWTPANVNRDWRPYTVGNWVYSDDFGWYWLSDSAEAEWGWVAFHYGRWAFDDSVGWFWIPGNEWGPAWVDWRRGDDYVGWAPLPPEDIVVEYREDPRFWFFVRTAQLLTPRIHTVIVPFDRRRAIIQQTVIVNRTLVPGGRRFAVNPGIAPGIIAAATRSPIRTFNVRPQVIAGTADIQGAVQVRADDLRRGGNRPGRSIAQARVVEQSNNTVQPATNVPAPQRSERGQLGDNPPRAAVGAQERGTPGATPPTQREGAAPNERRDDRERAQERGQTGTPGATPPNQRREGAAPNERGRDERGTVGTTPQQGQQGQAPREERRAPGNAPQQNAPQRDERSAAPPSPPRERVAPRQEQRQEQRPEQRQEQRQERGTSGSAPPVQREPQPQQQQAPQRQAPAAQAAPPPPPAARAPAAPPPAARPQAAPPAPNAPPARQEQKGEEKK